MTAPSPDHVPLTMTPKLESSLRYIASNDADPNSSVPRALFVELDAIREHLLAAEARVREVEKERDAEYQRINDRLAEVLPHVTSLRAERQGEVYEVAFIQPDCGDPTVPEHAEEWGVGLHGTMPGWLHPGDRVRVVRVEDAAHPEEEK